MTQEEKELLLKDLCARLVYGLKISKIVGDYISEPKTPKSINTDGCIVVENEPFDDGTPDIDYWYIAEVKPYLRPMSSMTEEEREELSDYLCEKVMSNKIGITIPPNPTHGKGIPFIWMGDCIDWLNVHHFDYRGLIEKGLALEAPEGMYKI